MPELDNRRRLSFRLSACVLENLFRPARLLQKSAEFLVVQISLRDVVTEGANTITSGK